jgi:hypothetical protein
MRLVHIIFVHKNPIQLERLIKAMAHKNMDFYIHVDKKVDKTAFEYLNKIKQVTFIKKRVACNWGGFSLVKAMMNSIDEIHASGIKYDFINIMSGQDYPIEPINDIYDFFNNHLGYSFINYEESFQSEWWSKAKFRYKHYHLTDFNFLGRYQLQKIVNWLLPYRKFPSSLTPYGSQVATWSTLSFESAIYLSSYIKTNSRLKRFLSFTWGCDEFAFITILMNSCYKDKIINDNCRYIVFSEGESRPKTFDINDYEKIIESKMLFARKFDINVDTQILDKLDTYRNKITI